VSERGVGRIFSRPGSRFWWVGYYHNGKQCREAARNVRSGKKIEATEEGREDAEKFLKHRLNQITAEKYGAKPFLGPQQERVTINEILDDLVARYARGGKSGIPREVSPQMKSHLKRLRDEFGTCRASRFGSKDVDQFVAKLRAERKANATINRSLQLLLQAYNLAVSTDPPKLNRALKIEMLDESGNRRTGKFTPAEAELIASSLPSYMRDVARFAYETGARASEILSLCWTHLDGDAIRVPWELTKNRESRSIAITEELERIIDRRSAAKVPGCDLIFHHEGQPITDYRKCWRTACVTNGLGAYYCRDCRNARGQYESQLDAEKKCPGCGKKSENPKYIGRIFHDFRRSAAYEMWKAGNSEEDCMKVTGHKTASIFKRYADLFSEEEERARQREVQQRRRDWRRQSQSENVVPPRLGVLQ